MSPKLLGLIIGGLLPALVYGIAGIFAKTSTNMGMPVGGHLISIGVATGLTGVFFSWILPSSMPSIGAIASSSMLGLFWGLGTGFVALGLLKYRTPLAKLVPLYNMNTLITVVLALIIFAEWKQTNTVQLVVGAGFIILGGLLVSGA